MLKKNWGEMADGLHCDAIIKLTYPNCGDCVYVYAMNPWDDSVKCVLTSRLGVELLNIDLDYLVNLHDPMGECAEIDWEFRPMCVGKLLKRLNYVA